MDIQNWQRILIFSLLSRWTPLLAIVIFAQSLSAAQINDLTNDFLTPSLEIYTGEDLSSSSPPQKNSDWKPLEKTNLGYSQDPVWVRYSVKNTTENPEWVVLFQEAAIDSIEYFQVSGRQVLNEGKIGSSYPVKDRLHATNQLIIPFNLEKQKTLSIYLKITSRSLLEIRHQIMPARSYFHMSLRQTIFFFLYAGVALSLLIYNLVLSRIDQVDYHLRYNYMIISFLTPQAAILGWMDYLLPISGGWGQFIHLFAANAGLALTLFLNRFLKLSDSPYKWHRIISYLTKAYGLLGFLSLTPLFTVVNPMIDGLMAILFPFVFMVVYQRLKTGFESARYILIGWGLALPFISAFFLVVLGVLPSFQDYQVLMHWASIFEMLGMTYAFSSQFHDSKIAQAIAEKKAEQETFVREKLSILVRTLSHDIANYLAIIYASSSLSLKSGNSVPSDKSSFERIHKAATKLGQILANVRDYLASTDGKLKIQTEPLLLEEAVEHIRFTFMDRLKEKGLTLKSQINSNPILVDRNLFLNHIINNLASNAIKYSPSGGTIIIKSTACLPETVCIEIIDEGIGIPMDLLKNIFDPSKPTSRVGTAGEKGTGFGMPLVFSYVKAMEGSIEILSPPQDAEKGTQVTLKFPRAKTKSQPTAA